MHAIPVFWGNFRESYTEKAQKLKFCKNVKRCTTFMRQATLYIQDRLIYKFAGFEHNSLLTYSLWQSLPLCPGMSQVPSFSRPSLGETCSTPVIPLPCISVLKKEYLLSKFYLFRKLETSYCYCKKFLLLKLFIYVIANCWNLVIIVWSAEMYNECISEENW